MTNHITINAIAANLSALNLALSEAALLAETAQTAMDAFEDSNLAVGTILPLEQELSACMHLVHTILALHRRAGQGGVP